MLSSLKNNVTLSDLAAVLDAFYIGGTKCGALFGEAIVIPDKNRLPHFITTIKQHGALLAKGRLLGIQFEMLFEDDLYFRIGEKAIQAADKIRSFLDAYGFRQYFASPTNQMLVLDDGWIVERVCALVPGGVDGVLELVGAPTLRDSLRATAPGGVVCFTGMLSDSWTIPDFYPMDWIPNGVRLTAYSGQSSDLPASELQRVLDRIAAGALELLPVHTYSLEDIVDAQRDMASGVRQGKLVGLPWD